VPEIKSNILNVQKESTLSPTIKNGVASQWGTVKWFIGTIISNIFNTQGRIKNIYLDAFTDILTNGNNNYIMKWTYNWGTNLGKFVVSSIYEDSTWRIGIGTNNPNESLTVNGRISVTSDPNSNDDVGNRNYNDGRYINVWESGDYILDDTIDSSEIQDGTITWTDIAYGTITSSDLADGTITGIDIANDTITSSDLGNNSVWNDEMIDTPIFTKIRMTSQTNSSDSLDTVVTKWYVDNNSAWLKLGDDLWIPSSTRCWWLTLRPSSFVAIWWKLGVQYYATRTVINSCYETTTCTSVYTTSMGQCSCSSTSENCSSGGE
jgi:hypothetical protein